MGDEEHLAAGDGVQTQILDSNEESLPTCTNRLGYKDDYRVHRYMLRADLNSFDEALRRAADRGDIDVLVLLLKARADPNKSADEIGVGFTQVGAFPLHIAAKRGNVALLARLFEAHAVIDVADQNGRTGLMVATASGQVESATWLIEHDADVNARSFYGFTPLLHAAQLPRYELVSYLLRSRASPSCVDLLGQSPLHVACKSLSSRVVRVEKSQDLSGWGDEYCYEQDTSHGSYGNRMTGAQETEQELAVRQTASELILCGADLDARDDSGRSVGEILEMKNRSDMRVALEAVVPRPPQPLESAQRRVVSAKPTCCSGISSCTLM